MFLVEGHVSFSTNKDKLEKWGRVWNELGEEWKLGSVFDIFKSFVENFSILNYSCQMSNGYLYAYLLAHANPNSFKIELHTSLTITKSL